MIEGQFTRIQSTSYLCQTSVDCRVCSECTSISIFQCPTCCAGSCHFYLIFLFLLHFLFSVFQCPAWRGCVVPAGCCHLYLPTTQGLIKHLLSRPWLGGSPPFCPVFSNIFYKKKADINQTQLLHQKSFRELRTRAKRQQSATPLYQRCSCQRRHLLAKKRKVYEEVHFFSKGTTPV